MHHPDREVYRGCKHCLFYTETGYEKEAWCEILRATAKMGSPANDWFIKTKREYEDYTHGVESHMPYVTRFHTEREANHFDVSRKEDSKSDDNKSDEALSKKRLIWKKLTRRNSKGKDNKETKSADAMDELANFTRRISVPSQGQDEGSVKRRESSIINDLEDVRNASIASQATSTDSGDGVQIEATTSDSEGDKSAVVATLNDDNESSVLSVAEQTKPEPKFSPGKDIDQSLLCLNMIVARLFFDFYHSSSRKARIQQIFQASCISPNSA